VNVKPQIFGGGHERGLRSGTLNVPAIVGFAKSVEFGEKEMKEENETYQEWTDRLYESLREELGDVERNGHPTERLAHNLNVYIPGIESRALIVDLKETAIATGSACTSADVEPSHVITAMHDDQRAHSSIRISVGRANDSDQIEEAARRIKDAAEELRSFSL
jgi:cysteine desulfurase